MYVAGICKILEHQSYLSAILHRREKCQDFSWLRFEVRGDVVVLFMVIPRVEGGFPRIVGAILKYVALKLAQGKEVSIGARPQRWRVSRDTHTCD